MTPTRRDFVAMLLGTPFAVSCAARAPSRIPPGAVIETGMRRGHGAIRDARMVPTPATWRRARVVVIGAGVAGLTAAWELRRRGVRDVLVLELDDRMGGTARGGESAVTRYPWGAHYIVAPQRDQLDLAALLAEMGAIEAYAPDGTPIIDEALRCREPEERVWYEGRWWEGLYLEAGADAADRAQLKRFRGELDRWAAWRDARGRRAFALPRAQCTDAAEVTALDRMSFAGWLDARGLTSPRLRWLCDYACRDDYALTAAQTSAWAGLFYFAARQRRAGAAPQTVVTWPDGNAELVRHLATGATIDHGLAVIDVGADGRLIALGEQGAVGIEADAVIAAVPSYVANRIVRGRGGAPHGDYGAWVVANVHLGSRPVERGRGAPPAWDNVFRDSPSLGYVCATHQRGRDRGPTVWTWYYAFADEDAAGVRSKLAGAGYPDWAEVVMSDLERAHPDVREHVERIELAFWGHGMIRPRVGTMFGGATPAATMPVGRIHFAHTDLSGLALFEEAFDHGLRAAREVAEVLAT
jgi:glycine/D-amino acid oxidase-like deaminating enzyme